MVSRAALRLAGGTPAIAAAHFRAEADPYHPSDNPNGWVNLGTAENRLVWDLLAPKLTGPRGTAAADVQYGPLHGRPELRAEVAGLLGAAWHTEVDPDDLVVVSGATAALDVLATALCDPGEAIAVPAPYYAAFDTDLVGRSGARLVPVPMPAETGFALDPALLDAALREQPGVRAIALTSPANPVGQVHSPEVLRAVLAVAVAHDVAVIADEIYTHSVFGPEPFTSTADPRVVGPHRDRVHVVWGFAKDFGLPGLKVGVLHTRHPQVRAAARELAYFAPVSTDTQALLTTLLADTAWVKEFLAESRHRLAESYRNTADLLARHGIGHVPAAGGFSVWLDLRARLTTPDAAGEHALWQRIVDGTRVNVLPGGPFGCGQPGWFRLCHATDPEHVATGVRRLAELIGGTR